MVIASAQLTNARTTQLLANAARPRRSVRAEYCNLDAAAAQECIAQAIELWVSRCSAVSTSRRQCLRTAVKAAQLCHARALHQKCHCRTACSHTRSAAAVAVVRACHERNALPVNMALQLKHDRCSSATYRRLRSHAACHNRRAMPVLFVPQ